AYRASLGFDNRCDARLAQRVLQDDVMHRVPVGNGNAPATELSEGPDPGIPTNNQARSVGVSPGKDLDRKFVVVAHPHRDRLQQMDEIELAGGEALNECRPASVQGWWCDLEAGVLEVSLGMSHKQRRGVGDGQITDAYDAIVLRARASQPGGREKRRETAARQAIERITPRPIRGCEIATTT